MLHALPACDRGDRGDTHLECQEFRGDTSLGDLDLSLAARPPSVGWSSGAGDVTLALPPGAYDLDLDLATDLGDLDLRGVRNSDAADASLRLHTGLGDSGLAG